MVGSGSHDRAFLHLHGCERVFDPDRHLPASNLGEVSVNTILDSLGLSAEAIATRANYIGGSDANTIMSGDDARILSLWRQKRGEQEPDDLSDILAVQMGSFTEPFNIAWYEKQTGNEVRENGTEFYHLGHKFMRATVDGIVSDPLYGGRAVFEAKHVGTRNTDAEIFDRYLPQLTHNALCADAESAVLSAFKGNGDWVMFEYDLDEAYAEALVEAEIRFWECVRTGEPPAPLPEPPKPKPRGVVEYDMAGNNAWSVHAGIIRETQQAARDHENAKKEIKTLVPDDASKAFGAGVTIKRDARGALRFTIEGE